jgi:hypothetical protein
MALLALGACALAGALAILLVRETRGRNVTVD